MEHSCSTQWVKMLKTTAAIQTKLIGQSHGSTDVIGSGLSQLPRRRSKIFSTETKIRRERTDAQEGLTVISRVSRRAFAGVSDTGTGDVSLEVAAMNIAVSQARSVNTSRNVEGVVAAFTGAGS